MRKPRVRLWRIGAVLPAATIAIGVSGCPNGMVSRRGDLDELARSKDTTSATVLRQADALYDFGPERPPITVSDPNFPGPHVGDGTIPRMWISTAVLKPGVPRPSTQILARIRSEGAYPQMGIQAGYSYIWRSSRDSAAAGTWVTKLVPVDTTAKQYTLTRDPRKIEYTHGDRKEPRLVRILVHSEGLGVCLDDPVCLPTGHCGSY